MPIPEFAESGDLPAGIHKATLEEVEDRFGKVPPARKQTVERLRRVYDLASSTDHLARFVIFGSFVTAKPEPNDVDIVMLMDDDFDASRLEGEAALLFDHAVAQSMFGASVFWLRKIAALGGEDDFVAGWQIKRDGTRRGIVEVIP